MIIVNFDSQGVGGSSSNKPGDEVGGGGVKSLLGSGEIPTGDGGGSPGGTGEDEQVGP